MLAIFRGVQDIDNLGSFKQRILCFVQDIAWCRYITLLGNVLSTFTNLQGGSEISDHVAVSRNTDLSTNKMYPTFITLPRSTPSKSEDSGGAFTFAFSAGSKALEIHSNATTGSTSQERGPKALRKALHGREIHQLCWLREPCTSTFCTLGSFKIHLFALPEWWFPIGISFSRGLFSGANC